MSAAKRRIYAAAVKLFAENGTGGVNISDLAQAAGVARGTIYSHLQSIDDLFEEVGQQLNDEMSARVMNSSSELEPALRLSHGIRFYIRRAHEEPDWGKFLVRYAMNSHSLRSMWTGQPMIDLLQGIKQGDYDINPEQLPTALALMGGAVLSAIVLVHDGHKTWRDAGTDIAEMILRALGVAKERARELATTELPLLVAE